MIKPDVSHPNTLLKVYRKRGLCGDHPNSLTWITLQPLTGQLLVQHLCAVSLLNELRRISFGLPNVASYCSYDWALKKQDPSLCAQ